MKQNSLRIAVIGAGITGLTTALHLQETGYRTLVYSPFVGDQNDLRETHPGFATLFPAACILPHSVEMPNLTGVFGASQEVFEQFSRIPGSGIRRQRHYEVDYGTGEPLPEYTRILQDFVIIGPGDDSFPFRKALPEEVTGWGASIFFAEMKPYLAYLLNRYHAAGGRIDRTSIDEEGVRRVPADAIINCTGLWAGTLFTDPAVHPIRGQLVLVEGAPLPQPVVVSYNYLPSPDMYQYDVYCFPRTDGWLLGGTREAGTRSSDGSWDFPPLHAEMIDGIPEPILTHNRAIMLHMTGVDLAKYRKSSATGYRPGRTGGVRLESSEESGRLVVHNYGHGGAGVALSWGCAGLVSEILGKSV